MATKKEVQKVQKILAQRKSLSSKKEAPKHVTGEKRKKLIDDEAEEVENWEEEEDEEEHETLSQVKQKVNSPLSDSLVESSEEEQEEKSKGFVETLKSKLHLRSGKKKRKVDDVSPPSSPALQACFSDSLQKITNNIPLLGQAELYVFLLLYLSILLYTC